MVGIILVVFNCVFVVLGVRCGFLLLCFYAVLMLSFIHRPLSVAFPIRIGASLQVADYLNLKLLLFGSVLIIGFVRSLMFRFGTADVQSLSICI